MDALLNRFRNLTILVVVLLAQLVGLAYQVKTNNQDERLVRVWAVSAVTPMAGIVEAIRRNTIGFLEDYFILLDVRDENRKLHADNDRLRMENIYYRNQLATAEHARALSVFQAQSPSKTVAARVIGNSTVATAKAVFIDRGSTSHIEKGMAVVTPEGIVGKVTAVYPLVSQVLLVTDPTFEVGVESQKSHVHGILDCGSGKCRVTQVQNEDKVDIGEWFYTSGEDRVFPRGFPVGTVTSAAPGQGMKDVKLDLSGAPGGVEQVLVVLEGVHQEIPDAPVEDTPEKLLPPPPPERDGQVTTATQPQTDADKLVQKYAAIGEVEDHKFGGYGSNLPNFNLKAPKAGAASTSTQSPQSAAHPGITAPAAPPEKAAAPAILGARNNGNPAKVRPPQSSATSTARPAVQTPGPVLPLGAPRHKSTTSTSTSGSTTTSGHTSTSAPQ
ncbi:MAG TPA: rod shape-determining protein MreC [Bryobacteraceae bacterium]|jgi:rod shape-determining protein MreC|nr:rod shape-determining protein MreC [Bryobacteraceae bacterium]